MNFIWELSASFQHISCRYSLYQNNQHTWVSWICHLMKPFIWFGIWTGCKPLLYYTVCLILNICMYHHIWNFIFSDAAFHGPVWWTLLYPIWWFVTPSFTFESYFTLVFTFTTLISVIPKCTKILYLLLLPQQFLLILTYLFK